MNKRPRCGSAGDWHSNIGNLQRPRNPRLMLSIRSNSRTILPELPDFISSMASLNFAIREAVCDHWQNVEARLDHGGHFVPRFIHLPSINSFDGQLIEDHKVPVNRSAAGHYAKQRDFPSVKHVRQNIRERFGIAGHFQGDIEPLLHAELLHRIDDFFRPHIQCNVGAHFSGEIETIRIHVGNYDMTGPGTFADRNSHAPDRACAGDENIFADQIERERGMHGVA